MIDQTVADLGEWGLITALARRLPPGPATRVGIGDDAAVLAAPDGNVVAAVDLLIEGRHFLREWSSAADIGVKAAARSLADIAAMGAVPTALLVGLATPGSLTARWVLDLASGLAEESARAGATVVGGDTAQSDKVTLSVTALGDLEGRAPVTRGGARPGDVVAVAGRLGHSAAGYALLAAGAADIPALTAAHLRPRPPYEAGPEAAGLGATAMIDVSDGLVADLGHIADASGAAVDIDSGALDRGDPLAGAAAALMACQTAGVGSGGQPDPLAWVLTGGEDHALVATFPPRAELPPRWRAIGEVRAGEGVSVDGERYAGRGGWEHFG